MAKRNRNGCGMYLFLQSSSETTESPGSQEDQNSTQKHAPHAMWGVGCGYSYIRGIRGIIPSSVHS